MMAKHLKTILWTGLATATVGGGWLAWYLLKPLDYEVRPAEFQCYNLKQGSRQAFTAQPKNIYGVGLAYSKHILETAADFHPHKAPPIFKKALNSLSMAQNGRVALPTPRQLRQAADTLEPGLGRRLKQDFSELPPLLDYEAELGFVLLENISMDDLKRADFAPALGYFVANDLSARTLAVLGEGRKNQHDYWGLSKSFAGFLPVSGQIYIPAEHKPNGLPCVTLTTKVNGVVRQNETTANLIYTPRQMLAYIVAKYPQATLRKGDLVLTGTPGGVAMATPRWLVRLSNLVGVDRFGKLSAVLGRDHSAFLKPNDRVTVEAQGIGRVVSQVGADN